MYRVFLITNLMNNKRFVSVQKRTLDDMKTNLRCKSNQVKQWNDSMFVGDLKAYGFENFNCTVLDETNLKNEANDIRDIYIAEYKTDIDGYNRRRLPGEHNTPEGAIFILALTNRRTGDVTVTLSDSPTNYHKLMLSAVNDKTSFAEFSRRSVDLSQRLIGCEIITYSESRDEADKYYKHLLEFLRVNTTLVRVTESKLKRILRAEVQNVKNQIELNKNREVKAYV